MARISVAAAWRQAARGSSIGIVGGVAMANASNAYRVAGNGRKAAGGGVAAAYVAASGIKQIWHGITSSGARHRQRNGMCGNMAATSASNGSVAVAGVSA